MWRNVFKKIKNISNRFVIFLFIKKYWWQNRIPPTTCRKIVLLSIFRLFPFDSLARTAWYSPSSSLHAEWMTSWVLVLSRYFSLLMSIWFVTLPFTLCQLIDQWNTCISFCFKSASKHVFSPHTTVSAPFIEISGSSITDIQNIFKQCYNVKSCCIELHFFIYHIYTNCMFPAFWNP